MPTRRELLAWSDVDRLVDVLLPQFRGEFDGMLVITRGGIVPGGLLSEALDIKHILIASVDFPAELREDFRAPTGPAGLAVWPTFLQFPEDPLLAGRRILVVDDVWGSGRTITAVKNRVIAAAGFPELCVFHYNPHRSLFGHSRPDYFGAITDAQVIYPWEAGRGPDRVLLEGPERG